MAEQDTELEDDVRIEDRSRARSGLPTIEPAEALSRLRAGKPLRDVRVEKLVLSGEFTQPVRVENCTLVKLRFDGGVFQSEVSFKQCTLESPHFARQNVFHSDFLIRHSTVLASQITRVEVHGAFSLEHSQVRGTFGVLNSRFLGLVKLWEATFHGWFNVKKCEFTGEADFRALHAHKGVTIAACRFTGPAAFRGMSVALKCDLSDSHFEGMVDFSRAKLNDYTYLEGIGQGPQQRFAFGNTIGERILIRPEQLLGRLESEQTGNHEEAQHEYAFFKRVFSTLHRYEQEDWAFYRFKVNQRRSKPRSWKQPWTRCTQFADWLLLDLGCGYGANPMRAVRAALIIMLGFGLIYMAGIEQFYIDAGKRPFPDQEVTSWPNRIMIGTLTSVSVFTSGVGGIREMAQGWMNIPLIVESLLGTLLWGLFIVAFSRKVIR
jgi:hypothetical protein